MNKKTYIILFVTIIISFVGIFLFRTLFVPQNDIITPEEAEKLCYSVLGEKDEDTGFPFSFGATGTYEEDGKQYHIIRASWLVNNSHLSYIGDFFVSVDGKEIYNGFAKSGSYEIENIIWSE